MEEINEKHTIKKNTETADLIDVLHNKNIQCRQMLYLAVSHSIFDVLKYYDKNLYGLR